MDQVKFCTIGSAIAGFAGSVALASVIGPVAVLMPALCGLAGRKLAEVHGLGETKSNNKRYSLPYEAGKHDYSSLDFLVKQQKDSDLTGFKQIHVTESHRKNSDFLPVFNIPAISQDFHMTEIRERKPGQSKASKGFKGLAGARGSLENEAYFRRRR